MAMSQCDDVFSVDEDFEDAEQVLHPSLAIPIATNGRKRKGVTPGAATPAAPQRGRGWRESDSILLVKAYEWVEKTKRGIYHYL